MVPETPEGLRRILGRVNLRKWFQEVMCGPEEASVEDSGRCREMVKGALAASMPEVAATMTGVDIIIPVRWGTTRLLFTTHDGRRK